jgi:hypothetical protein
LVQKEKLGFRELIDENQRRSAQNVIDLQMRVVRVDSGGDWRS